MKVEIICGVKGNEVIAVTDEEGRVLGATKTEDKVLEVIKANYFDSEVELKKVEHNKHDVTTKLYVDLRDDVDDEEGNEHVFTLSTIIVY